MWLDLQVFAIPLLRLGALLMQVLYKRAFRPKSRQWKSKKPLWDYGGSGGVTAWACMAATGAGSVIFTDDRTPVGSAKMNSEVHKQMLQH